MQVADGLDLTYCTNIHAAAGWGEVSRRLATFGPALKRRLSAGAPFGLGLRLSNAEAVELLEGTRLPDFAAGLHDEGLYVSLLNGYPYGPFHGAPVKTGVFAPDWRDRERVEYTRRLIRIAAALLPDGAEGGISTVPLSYKPWVAADVPAAMTAIVHHLVEIASALIGERRTSGRRLRLDIEPEPDGLLENSTEVVAFYRDWLLPFGAPLLAADLGESTHEAERLILDHLCVCYDTCHLAIAYEEPDPALDALAAQGIRVGRVQLSSALRVSLPARGIADALAAFEDGVYLHQVGERRTDGSVRRFRDLGDALATVDEPHPREWRIHCHVPLFAPEYGTLGSTRDHITSLLTRLRRSRFTSHLEIETYTWEVLPPSMKFDLLNSIEREYRWVLAESCARPSF